jgi:signal transduction histidine kinase
MRMQSHVSLARAAQASKDLFRLCRETRERIDLMTPEKTIELAIALLDDTQQELRKLVAEMQTKTNALEELAKELRAAIEKQNIPKFPNSY